MKEGHGQKLWDGHHQGRLLLLRLRGPQQLSSEVGQAMFRIVYTQVVSVLNH
jgi:hypothetical protein